MGTWLKFLLLSIITIIIIIIPVGCKPTLYESTEGIEYRVIGNIRVFERPKQDSPVLQVVSPNSYVKSIGLCPENWHHVVCQENDVIGYIHHNGLQLPSLLKGTKTQIQWSKRAENQSLSQDSNLSIVEKRATLFREAIDYTSPKVRNFALEKVKHSGERNVYQVCDLFDVLMSQWTYVSDTTHLDYYASASESIQNGLKGDCDDYAVLMVSLILSIGGGARIVNACDPVEGCHAYAELFLTTDRKEAENIFRAILKRYKPNESGEHLLPFKPEESSGAYWLNLDWWSNYPGGKSFGKRKQAIYPNGCFELYDDNEQLIGQGCV